LAFFSSFIFCLCRPSEANLQLSCQPCWLPNKEGHVPAGWRDAGFEPRTAGFTVWCTTIEPPHPPSLGCGGSILGDVVAQLGDMMAQWGDVVAQGGMWWLNGGMWWLNVGMWWLNKGMWWP